MAPSTSMSEQGETLSKAALKRSVRLVQVKPGMQIAEQMLRDLLPDVSTTLFFGKLYQLDAQQLGQLLHLLFRSDLTQALLAEGSEHSTELQDYLVEIAPPEVLARIGSANFDPDAPVPSAELLTEAFKQATVTVASSIQEVADALGEVLHAMPSKYGTMTFQHLHQLNVQRNSIGTFSPVIEHQATPNRLVILDVSGSMTVSTVERIVDEVVGLAFDINAYLAIVSNSAFLWEPGTFTSGDVLQAAEFGGTRYETLAPVLDLDWDTVVTIADYDSSGSAKDYIARTSMGRVREVIDISLVNEPTFLAQCVGQLAQSVRPILIGNNYDVLS